MKIVPEIDIDKQTHKKIQHLRNNSFPDDAVNRSYFKQLPHMRCLQYEHSELIGYMGLDYRVIGTGNNAFKILGVIDFCITENKRRQGIGSTMLEELTDFATQRDVDFIILVSDNPDFYVRNGFSRIKTHCSWLRIDEHKNYGVAFDYLDDLYIKPTGDKDWKCDHVDWLGYMF